MYPRSHYWESITVNYGFEVLLARYQQPGYYNDPNFLTVDWPWLTLDEKNSHFALWLFSAPLIMSSYIPDLTEWEIEYLTNEDISAIDQDPLALQATLVSQDGYFDVPTKSLVNGDRLLTVLNRGNDTNATRVSMERMGLKKGCKITFENLWTRHSTVAYGSIDITLKTHATAIYHISGFSSPTLTGMIFNTASLKCMTALNSSITFDNCTGADTQVWQVSSSGMVSPLSASQRCLQSTGQVVSLGKCSSRRATMRWTYHIAGNLVNEATKLCLQQSWGCIGVCGEEFDNKFLAFRAESR